MLNYLKKQTFYIKETNGGFKEIKNGAYLLSEDLIKIQKELLHYKESFTRLNAELEECKIITNSLTNKIL